MTKYDKIKAWLPEAIEKYDGNRERIMTDADRLNYNETMISRAKAELGIEHTQGRDRKWVKP